jgi:cyclophilin family peptidyl-prolyl cis-trans isomerase
MAKDRRMHVARLLLLVALTLGLAACGGGDEESNATTEAAATSSESTGEGTGCEQVDAPEAKPDGGQQAPTEALDSAKTYRLVVETNCGSFTIELDQEKAPKTAASLVALAESGFYDGTTFHRVVPGFVIQGGDPTGTGGGGPGYKTVDVPPADAAYTKGVVAMAKAGNEAPGTSGSQFFVVTAPDAGLTADYAVVGEVTEGIEAVEAIEALGVGDGPPSQPVVMEKVTVESS